MLQDSRTARTNTTSGTGTAGVSRTLTRRMTNNGCSRRSERKYEIGSATDFFMNDFDDERTLDEEEAMEGSEDSHNELSNLQKERDMPLKELLAKYGYSHTSTDNSNSSDQLVLLREGEEPGSGLASEKTGENDGDEFEDEEEDDEDEDDGDDDEDEDDDEDDRTVRKKIGSKSQPSLRQFYTEMVKEEEAERLNTTEVGRDTTGNLVSGQSGDGPAPGINSDIGNNTHNNGENNSGTGRRRDDDDDDDDEDDEEDDDEDGEGAGVVGNTGTSGVGSGNVSGGSSRLLRSVSRPQSEEEDDDCDYSPDEEEWKKTIMVGSDYQATIPEGLCRYDDALPYENEDKILWNPSYIPEEETEEFLERAQLPTNKVNALPAGAHIRDDEQALYLLLQCGYNLEEALRRRRMNVLPPTDAISLWSEEECHNFESGLRTYGKDFHLIQKNKVRTRSVGELVQFYYLWKKTERHDIFTYKARLEKKKYALHPGITDYMDRFLEEQEGVRDRSSSPNVNCLILGDVKRQRTSTNMTNNHAEGGKSTESWDGTANEDPLGDLNNAENLTSTVTSPSSSLLPPPAPPSVPSAPTTTPPSSASPSLTTSSNLAQTNSTPTVPQNHEPVSHDYTPTSDNVLSNLPP
ncbi:mesoderm induction early response protein 1 isoform X2 [Chelonus insularis]|uniref:mesoderm induction early response protein 1 isoform X2 n=1 Tax=Chelonus insularis TaxID=460826 RepID=UPI00158EBA91|nr:mesoderm induction early response protein 1 isoform X2 [Chelonus insularis]